MACENAAKPLLGRDFVTARTACGLRERGKPLLGRDFVTARMAYGLRERGKAASRT